MVSRHIVEQQLHRIGFNPFTWGRTEVRELCHIMMDDEEIIECVNGEYSNGFALLAATNHRVLLVDKKPFLYLTVEDVRFEQISDFNFRNRFISASVTISTSNKTLQFVSYNKKRLRSLINCVQKRVVALREGNQPGQQFQQALMAHLQAGYAAAGTPTPAQLPYQAQAAQPEPAEPVAPPSTTQPSQSVIDVPPQPQPADAVTSVQHHASRLGTYTRSKLPAFYHRQDGTNAPAESGDIYQRGYAPGSVPDYQMPAQ